MNGLQRYSTIGQYYWNRITGQIDAFLQTPAGHTVTMAGVVAGIAVATTHTDPAGRLAGIIATVDGPAAIMVYQARHAISQAICDARERNYAFEQVSESEAVLHAEKEMPPTYLPELPTAKLTMPAASAVMMAQPKKP